MLDAALNMEGEHGLGGFLISIQSSLQKLLMLIRGDFPRYDRATIW